MTFYYVLQHCGVAVSAVTGVLAARGRSIDLFGVVVLALVVAVGGGTIRDLCLGATPVFWIEDSRYILTALTAALLTFFTARWADLPRGLLEVADAIALGMFTIIGLQKSLHFETAGIIAVGLGTITGVAGGIGRDLLLNELPLVFRKDIRLYATAAIAGAIVYLLVEPLIPENAAAIIGSTVIVIVRFVSIRWQLALPLFRTRQAED